MSKTLTEGLTPQTENRAELALFAVIKPSSKYAYQGRYTGKPVAMRVTFLEDRTDYAFHLENGNRYRREDLTFYVQSGGKLIKLR
jgi:hypothetical protein